MLRDQSRRDSTKRVRCAAQVFADRVIPFQQNRLGTALAAQPGRMAPALRDTVVIGASAGGLDALTRLLPQLPTELPASVFITLHLSPDRSSSLPDILARSSTLAVQFARDGMATRPGRIYLAPPDRHLVLVDDHVSLIHGPRENRARPAIDPLFRSAAVQRRARVVGVVLSGLLDDGASGLLAIKRCGGLALVQDPNDAREPSMPQQASNLLGALLDGAHDIEALAHAIVNAVGVAVTMPPHIPHDLLLETEMLASSTPDPEHFGVLGKPVPLSCPECGGPLSEVGVSESLRYRCYVGHSYTARNLLADQDRRVESALWAALRSMEERSRTLRALAAQSRASGLERSAMTLQEEAVQMHTHARTLRAILLQGRTGLAD